MAPPAWQPLFSGKAAEPYTEAIDAIVEAIDRRAGGDTDWGRPVLYAYLAKARHSTRLALRTEALIDGALDAMERGFQRPSLYDGFAGVGWMSAHVAALFDIRDDELYEQIDEAALCACGAHATRFDYDLISGVVGLGVYFLERLPHPIARDGLNRVVDALERHAEQIGDHVTWHTPASQLAEWQRPRVPDGYYNLGVSHGVPGIIGFLAEMRRAALLGPRAETLLRRATCWVLSQRLPDGSFSSWIAPGTKPEKPRVRWCYGELGIAVVILLAARGLDDSAIEEQALDIARMSARRRIDAGAADACLCHGAAGNAHLFNRIFQATRRQEFMDAAVFWFDCALKMRVDGAGIAGFRAWRRESVDGSPVGPSWHDDVSFLTGAAGIALTFLGATTSLEPAWDRVLLSSLEPRRPLVE